MTKGDDVTVVQMETVGTGTLGEVRSRTGPGDPGPDPDRWLDGVLGAVSAARHRVLRGAPGLDDGQLERGLVATEAVRRAVDGLELALVAEVGRRGEERGPDGRYRDVRLPAGTVADMAPDAVAVATGIGPTEASRRCAVASRAATDLAALAALVAEGKVSIRWNTVLDAVLGDDRGVTGMRLRPAAGGGGVWNPRSVRPVASGRPSSGRPNGSTIRPTHASDVAIAGANRSSAGAPTDSPSAAPSGRTSSFLTFLL